MIPDYDHLWRASRRICDVLTDAQRGVAAELLAIVADADASDALDSLDLTPPSEFLVLDHERELARLPVNALCVVCVYPGPEVARRSLLGDLDTRTEEVVWRAWVAVRLVREAAAAELVESWDTVDFDSRERRRLNVIMGAVTNVIERDARDGTNIPQIVPAGKAEHGVQGIEPAGEARWARKPFEVLQHVTIPSYAVPPP